jgi:hypothetical protein
MRKTLLTLILLATGSMIMNASAQTIPNAGFETWSGGLPTGWYDYGMSQAGINAVLQSSDAYAGTSSVKLATVTYMGSTVSGILITNNGNFLPTTLKPAYLNGYIKSNLASTDTFIVAGIFNNNSNANAGGSNLTHATFSTWTPFHITLSYPPGFTPDSFGVALLLNATATSSYVMIDNLSFSSSPIGSELGTRMALGTQTINRQTVNSSLYPNPATTSAAINFTLTLPTAVSVNVYDITGRLVKNVLHENRTAGNQQVQINTEDLQNGIYFYTISGNGFSETKKFVIVK